MIKLANINKSFDNKLIFNNFNLEVKKGEFLGIFGKSGRGKTTLLNIIGTLETFDSGTLEINGTNINNNKQRKLLLRHDLGFVFQNYALIDNATVFENLELALKYKLIGKNLKKEAIIHSLKEVGLEDFSSKKVYTLSGGEQQRVAIARLLLKDPNIILADEPTGSLDIENRNMIITLFQKLHNQGKTIVIVTHDHDLARLFSRTIQL